MLHLAIELFLCMKSFSVSNAIPTCLDKTPLIVNIRKAEVRCLWRKSHVRNLDRTRAHTGCCSPDFLFDFLTFLQVSAQTCCWEVPLCWAGRKAHIPDFPPTYKVHIEKLSSKRREHSVEAYQPRLPKLTKFFPFEFSVFLIPTQNKMVNNKGVTITQRESFSYLGKH